MALQDELTLRADEVTVRADDVSLRADDVSLRADDLTVRAQDLTLRAQDLTVRADGLSLRADNISVRTDERAVRTKALTRRPDHRGLDNHPRKRRGPPLGLGIFGFPIPSEASTAGPSGLGPKQSLCARLSTTKPARPAPLVRETGNKRNQSGVATLASDRGKSIETSGRVPLVARLPVCLTHVHALADPPLTHLWHLHIGPPVPPAIRTDE
jgi:hypothetical protein